jgi:ABC-type Zn2+ transport system substrate-binding protein/surface adhesin
MGETKDQIENQIEDAREDLGSNLQELERKVKSVTDWKYLLCQESHDYYRGRFRRGGSPGSDVG